MADETLTSEAQADPAATETTQAAPETAAPVETKTIAEGAEPTKEAPKPDWPDDWREKLAAGDEKLQKRLARFQSPANVLKSWLSLEQRMSSGELRAKLPDGATPEQVAAWRQENGIPEKAEGYLDGLPDGLVIGDADKPVLKAFAEKMHAQNAPPGVVKEAVAWYFAEQQARAEQQAIADREFQQQAEDALRAEWGAEYRANVNGIKNFLASAPDGLGDALMTARLGDGTVLGNNPVALKWLAGLVAEINPAATLAPNSSAPLKSIDDEIATIERKQRENMAAYDRDLPLQARYRELLVAREKMRARAA